MIPTHHKSKLPGTLSWPLGAAAISTALGEAPHVAECRLWFLDTSVRPHAEFQRLLRESRPYAVVVVQYRPAIRMPYSASYWMEEQGFYDAQWEILIHPVPRSWRAAVAGLLRERGFPGVVEWLRSIPEIGWEDRLHRLELVYSPLDNALTFQQREGV
jgi:hypothetical protein